MNIKFWKKKEKSEHSLLKTEDKKEISQQTNPTEAEMQVQFEQETGKNAVWRGKVTKQYLEWKDDNF